MNKWRPYLIAIAVGLLVGIERENSKTEEKAFGVRTFVLLSLLGALAGGLQNSVFSYLIAAFALSLIVISYYLELFSKKNNIDVGLTTEFAAGIVFTAGYIAHTAPLVSVLIGPLVAMILFSKKSLHQFIYRIKPLELKATITILLIAVVVADFIPDIAIDPWGLFNLRKFGSIILILAALEFSSYIIVKAIGEKNGSLIIGFLGGLVSSTAVLIASSRQAAKATDSWPHLLGSCLAAQLASLIETAFIVLLVSPILFMQVYIPITIGVAFISLVLLFLRNKKTDLTSELILKSPLDWSGVFRLSIFFCFVLGLISIAEHWLGSNATFALSFLTGLFELQGISLANATLFGQGLMSIQNASICIFLSLIASIISKILISWFFVRNKFTIYLTFILLPLILVISLASLISIRWLY